MMKLTCDSERELKLDHSAGLVLKWRDGSGAHADRRYCNAKFTLRVRSGDVCCVERQYAMWNFLQSILSYDIESSRSEFYI